MAMKQIIADLNKGEKLNGDDFKIWHHKVAFIIEDQKATKAWTLPWKSHKSLDMEACKAWRTKNFTVWITRLSSMKNSIMCQYEHYRTASEMWLAMKKDFGATFATKLWELVIKFDNFKKHTNVRMLKHLRLMVNLVNDLKIVGYVLTDEQQVQVVIRSLQKFWEHMKVLIH